MPVLLNFKTRDGDLNIAQEVGGEHNQFGSIILNDDTGAVCKRIALNNSNVTSTNQEILSQWLQGKGKVPIQWLTLTEVLRGVELNTLASTIEHNLPLNILTDH